MTTKATYKSGEFCWHDLSTVDTAKAKTFYTQIFGWDTADSKTGDGGVYTELINKDKRVGGLFNMSEEETKHHIPSHWNSYVCVTNCDETTGRVESLGGKVIKSPFDITDVGRMSVIQDPTGAHVCLWQPNKNMGAEAVNEVGAFCWTELITSDTKKACDFYTTLLGWTAEETQLGPIIYTFFKVGGENVGGMIQKNPMMGNIPSAWLGYLAVNDCDKTVEQTKSLGGQVVMDPMDIAVGRFAIIQDPTNAVIGVIKVKDMA